jgi:iron complex outermembrane recepter protein
MTIQVVRRTDVSAGLSAPFQVAMLAALGSIACPKPCSADMSLQQPVDFQIASQPLDSALLEFGRQARVSVLADPALLEAVDAPALQGQLSNSDALARLLASSGLTYVKVGNAVSISAMQVADLVIANGTLQEGTENRTESERASASAAESSNSELSKTSNSRLGLGMEEILVTAQKREERLQDVPAPVTALSTDELLEKDQIRLQDYYTSVPGLSLTSDARGSAQLAIRGITTGAGSGNPTISVAVDGVPYGSSSSYGGAGQPIPDLDPSDIARVEVLRGPQGTLYGASSIGGLINFVTVTPSPSAFSGRMQLDMDGVSNGEGVGYGVRGAANMPLTDSMAVRASAFSRRDPGYIDNVVSGEKGVNEVKSYGGHLAGLWQPFEDLSIKLSALYQDTKGYGSPNVDPTLGDLRQSNIPGSGEFDIQNQAYTATVKAKIARIDISSVTGYSRMELAESQDQTPLLGGISEYFGVPGAILTQDIVTDKFSQELQASIPISKMLDLLIGGFYTSENSHVNQNWYAADANSGAIVDNTLLGYWPTSFKEYAAFADLTIHMTSNMEIQVGGRESRNKQTYAEVDGGNYSLILFSVPGPLVTPRVDTDDNSFTYLGTLRYKLSQDLMTYLRFASGYRPGGPNAACIPFGVPCEFGPDKTENYELGVKGDSWNHLFSFDASLYYINWKDIQLSYLSSGGTYYTNGSRARSRGVEFSLQSNPIRGLTLQLVGTLANAELTQPLAPESPVVGASGDRLPGGARVSGALSVQQEFPLKGAANLFIGGGLSYVGERLGQFTPASLGARISYPAYAETDLRGGVRFSSYTLSIYANNVTNRRGVLSGGPPASGLTGFFYIEPRKIGLSISSSF